MLSKQLICGLRRYFCHSSPWLTGAAATIISLGMWQLNAWQPLERVGYKLLFQIRETGVLSQQEWDKRIVVIAIDEKSLQKYGQFPWQRDRYIPLLNALQKSRPTAIGFDIKFVDRSDKDAEFAKAIEQTGNVVLARAWDDQGKPLVPVPELSEAASDQGHISRQVDGDGITRQAPIWINSEDFSLPSLGLTMIEVYNLNQTKQPISLPQPINQQFQNIWLNWPATVVSSVNNPQKSSPTTYSFVDVAEGRIPSDKFTDKFVLVGFTALALNDPLRTPYNSEPPTSGVYFHAAVIDNLINKTWLKKLPDGQEFYLLVLLAFGASCLFFGSDLKTRIILIVILPIAWFGIANVVFAFYQWWIPIAAPIGTILIAAVGLQLREQYEKQQLMSLFAKHVSPETAQLIWQRKEEIIEDGKLQAQELIATVLFMDIRGFTTISENLKPRELLSWLNQYLDVMTNCIMDHGGVVDKYIGDAIMAVFGVPFPNTKPEGIRQDALNAIAASIAMHSRLRQLNKRLKSQGKPVIEFGIGIHTGMLIAGSVGGTRRLNYSVVGDTVNVASRLESMNKELTADKPFKILLTDETFSYVSDRYRGEQVKTIQLRGRQQETMIYTILGKKKRSLSGL
ncbi:CHASE2 domain-containing protein [Floridanema aerugineum]|uniref:CHASE2 domain-containing protein n=1 Tax=Floridaenema aerugineum BLCC-F46 TaxID=3153654 RepID=A0ABV4X0W2_9CYAN